LQDQQAVARINAQIEALLAPPTGGLALQYYAKPVPPQNDQKPPMPAGAVLRDDRGRPAKYVIARAGDGVYATLDRAFSSNDPQAPIFATIHDVDAGGVQGPLDGVRMVGIIVYSASQGTIHFNCGYLPDGRALLVKAMAVSVDTARAGVAKNVDYSLSSLFGQPPTISGPAGMGLNLVFLEPVAVPRDLLFER
jgi:intracellular multiplication protein IcmE